MPDPDAIDEVWSDGTLYTFDGRILELFGFFGQGGLRLHVRNLALEVGEPNRKGKRGVSLSQRRGGGGVGLSVSEADWVTLGPFLDRVRAAIPPEDPIG
jgi:hypothetical protein